MNKDQEIDEIISDGSELISIRGGTGILEEIYEESKEDDQDLSIQNKDDKYIEEN